MKRIRSGLILAMLLASTSVASAMAARIYNELPKAVKIIVSPSAFLTLKPGARSESLEWPGVRALSVKGLSSSFMIVSGSVGKSPLQLCAMNFGYSADIQGGNYMTIGFDGHHYVCTTCNSKHQVMHQATSGDSPEFVERKPTHVGC